MDIMSVAVLERVRATKWIAVHTHPLVKSRVRNRLHAAFSWRERIGHKKVPRQLIWDSN